MGKKRNFIPKQNTHDLLVGTLSIGIPSVILLHSFVLKVRVCRTGKWPISLLRDVVFLLH